MIFRAYVEPSSYITLVVRADTEEHAHALALTAARQYSPDNTVELERIDPDGPAGVIVEDAS